MLHRVAWQSLGMLAVLIVFKFLKELVVGMVHSKGIIEILAELGEQSWLSLLGPMLLMLLILIPMIAAMELDRALGEKGLKGLLLETRQ